MIGVEVAEFGDDVVDEIELAVESKGVLAREFPRTDDEI